MKASGARSRHCAREPDVLEGAATGMADGTMRSIDFGGRPDGERWRILHAFEPVRGITVAVVEPEVDPDTLNLVMLDTLEGVSVVAEYDHTSPGARARAVTLGETVHEALEMAEMTWRPPEEPPRRRGRRTAPTG